MPTKKKINSHLLKAESIGHNALKALSSSKKTAKVHSVFDRGFYIQFGRNPLINVIKNSNYISPTSILIREPENGGFKSIGLEEGMKIEVKKNSLIFGDNLLEIKFDKASTWFSPPLPKWGDLVSLSKISLNLRILRDVIYTCPSREGLVPLLENVELHGPLQFFLKPQKPTLSERGRPHIDMLMWGLFGGDLNMTVSGAFAILGLGPGLTPSCDDFLAGLILSLAVGGKLLLKKRKNELEFYRKVSAQICRASKEKTTIYSQNFLNESHSGEGPRAVVELIHSLLTKNPNEVAAISKTVISMGETSGADIAIGVYYGIRFLFSRLERIEDLNEFAN
ncbi:MAG: DUF2877 domain-containing protein [Deltaproteobacteria bacterium]|nr:DUF2877 domain-containing protein [Deltaproteobacteria bacterium]